MKTIPTNVYRVLQGSKTIYISIKSIKESEMDDHYDRDLQLPLTIQKEILDIPVVTSEIKIWDEGTDLCPHLHFTCPNCSETHNVDLEKDDSNPRLGVCDSCGWDDLVWIEWKEEQLSKLKKS